MQYTFFSVFWPLTTLYNGGGKCYVISLICEMPSTQFFSEMFVIQKLIRLTSKWSSIHETPSGGSAVPKSQWEAECHLARWFTFTVQYELLYKVLSSFTTKGIHSSTTATRLVPKGTCHLYLGHMTLTGEYKTVL